MKTFRTAASIVVMIIAGATGFLVGSALNEGMNGAILFVLIAGIACIIYAIDNQEQ